jgi:dihydrofolate reductase
MIVACSQNRVIGKNGGIPWCIKADLAHFKTTTLGKPVIVGRKTFESYPGGKALPDRLNIIVTRDKNYKQDDAEIVHSLCDGIKRARAENTDEIFIGGGAEIYKQALPHADRLYISIIHTDVEDGDAFFPDIDLGEWSLTSEEHYKAKDGDIADWTLRLYDRRQR